MGQNKTQVSVLPGFWWVGTGGQVDATPALPMIRRHADTIRWWHNVIMPLTDLQTSEWSL